MFIAGVSRLGASVEIKNLRRGFFTFLGSTRSHEKCELSYEWRRQTYSENHLPDRAALVNWTPRRTVSGIACADSHNWEPRWVSCVPFYDAQHVIKSTVSSWTWMCWLKFLPPTVSHPSHVQLHSVLLIHATCSSIVEIKFLHSNFQSQKKCSTCSARCLRGEVIY